MFSIQILFTQFRGALQLSQHLDTIYGYLNACCSITTADPLLMLQNLLSFDLTPRIQQKEDIQVYMYMYTYMYVCVRACVCVCVCVHIN